MLADIETAFTEVRKGRTGNRLAQQYQERQIHLSYDLDKSHLQTAMRNALIRALDSLNRRASLTFSTRAPSGLSKGGAELPAKIVRDAWSNKRVQLERDISDLCSLTRPNFTDVQLGCGAVALQLGAWPTAANIAERLISDLTPDEASSELGSDLKWKLAESHFIRASSLRALVWVEFHKIIDTENGRQSIRSMLDSGLLHLDTAEQLFDELDDLVGLSLVRAARAMHIATRLLLSASGCPVFEDENDAMHQDWASSVLKYARDALDAASEPAVKPNRDLAGRSFEVTLKAKGAIAALLCRLAIHKLKLKMPSVDAVRFSRFHEEIHNAVKTQEKTLTFEVWKIILRLSDAIETEDQARIFKQVHAEIEEMLGTETVSRPERNLEIRFLQLVTEHH